MHNSASCILKLCHRHSCCSVVLQKHLQGQQGRLSLWYQELGSWQLAWHGDESEQSTPCGLSLTLVVQQGAILHRLPKAVGQGTARPWEQSCSGRAAWTGGHLALNPAVPLPTAEEHLEDSVGVSPGVFLFSCLKLTK